MTGVDDAANALLKCKDNIEKGGIARLHRDTLEKRGIYVDQCLTPSIDKDLKKIKYYSRITKKIKDNFLTGEAFDFNQPIPFSEQGYNGHGHEWDKLLSDYIKDTTTEHKRESIKVAEELITTITDYIELATDYREGTEEFKFLESKFALFGFMRERDTNDKKTSSKLYLWQGEADAIAYSKKLKRYIIVDFKVVDDLLDYWQKKTDLCGKHLHQCLVYAKLLQLHMKLTYLPPIMIVVIDRRFSGKQGFLPLFKCYPDECQDKLDEYEWFTEQPPKLPLKMVKNGKLFHETIVAGVDFVVPSNKPLKEIFIDTATVRDLLEALHLDYDVLKIVSP